MKKDSKIMIMKDTPYLISGDLPINKEIIWIGREDEPEKWIKGKRIVPFGSPCALCRCGGSKNKPLCDGTYGKIRFDGTETASKKPYDRQAQVMDGPTLRRKDA
jgi:CDGSH-type Zn-finger protein